MMTTEHPDDDLTQPTDPAQLGTDQGPGAAPAEDSRDMSTILANADNARHQGPGATNQDASAGRGSDFDQLRRQGAEGSGDNSGTVGRGQGMGRTSNGDEDRGYDQSGHRGGLGTSGGREDLSDRHFDPDQNAFTGGYGGSDHDQPENDELRQKLGLHTPNPADEQETNKTE